MTNEEYLELYRTHKDIAMRLMLCISNRREAREAADYATNLAILTHNPELGSLTTHVHYLALQERQKLLRQKTKLTGEFNVKNLYRRRPTECGVQELKYRRHQRMDKTQQEDSKERRSNSFAEAEILPIDQDSKKDIDLFTDVEEYIIQLEESDPKYKGRLKAIVELWLEGYSNRDIAEAAGVSHTSINKIKQDFKNLLSEKFSCLL